MLKHEFDINPILNEEKISQKRRNAIKASVLAKTGLETQEEKTMKKLRIKPLFIGAAAAAAAALTLVTANAATNGRILESVTNYIVSFNGKDYNVEAGTYTDENGGSDVVFDADIPEVIQAEGFKLDFSDGETLKFIRTDDEPDLYTFHLEFPRELENNIGIIYNMNGEIRPVYGDDVKNIASLCGANEGYSVAYLVTEPDGSTHTHTENHGFKYGYSSFGYAGGVGNGKDGDTLLIAGSYNVSYARYELCDSQSDDETFAMISILYGLGSEESASFQVYDKETGECVRSIPCEIIL